MPPSNSKAQLFYQVCPIILTGGAISQVSGGVLPMLSLFYSTGSALELPYDIDDLDNAFGAFNVLPGGTLVAQTIGKYPFANQSVAANAMIREPLTLSVIMDTPMRGPDAWNKKQSVMTALKLALDGHNNAGGMYTVATPAFIYQNLVMTALTDNSRGNNSLPQNAWRFDFEGPLITIAAAQGSQNQLMQKISNQVYNPGNITGAQPGTTTGKIEIGGTPTLAGILSGGNVASLGSVTSPTMINYPALSPPAAFPFTGIS
jgi:hypothetical protein